MQSIGFEIRIPRLVHAFKDVISEAFLIHKNGGDIEITFLFSFYAFLSIFVQGTLLKV